MRLIRGVAAALMASCLAVGGDYAQAPAATSGPLKFEVASIKPSPPSSSTNGSVRPAPGGERYIATNCPLKLLITVAFKVKREQIIGGPAWIDSEPFEMDARAGRQATIEELRLMLRELLAERFQLRFHRETKELPVYALSVDKSGPKLQAHELQNAGEQWIEQTTERMLHVKLIAKLVTMDYFAFRLGQVLDRPVIDLTKLKGNFDFELAYTRDLPAGVSPTAQLNGEPLDTSGPTIFGAIRQQLGLELKPQKGPVETIVIDHVDKPSAN